MADLKKDIGEMSREDLETLAMNVAGMNTFKMCDLSGNILCYISTTADPKLLNRIWNNLRELDRHVSFEQLVEELNDRDYYAEIVPVKDFLVMNF